MKITSVKAIAFTFDHARERGRPYRPPAPRAGPSERFMGNV